MSRTEGEGISDQGIRCGMDVDDMNPKNMIGRWVAMRNEKNTGSYAARTDDGGIVILRNRVAARRV